MSDDTTRCLAEAERLLYRARELVDDCYPGLIRDGSRTHELQMQCDSFLHNINLFLDATPAPPAPVPDGAAALAEALLAAAEKFERIQFVTFPDEMSYSRAVDGEQEARDALAAYRAHHPTTATQTEAKG